MNELLTKQLEQINKLISGLKGEYSDLERLMELGRSLDLLGHQIKTLPKESFTEEKEWSDSQLRQDAVFYYNRQFQMIRFIGSLNNLAGNGNKDTLPEIEFLFTKKGFDDFKEKTKLLLKTGTPQSFHSEIYSKNDILLPVHFILENMQVGNNQNIFSAGMVFSSHTPAEIENYRDVLIENIPGIDLFLFDTSYRFIMAGGREKRRMGLTNADFLGKTLFEMYNEKTVKLLFPFFRNALDGIESEGEIRIKRKVYQVQATPVMGLHNRIIGGALISQDITVEKEIEKNLLKSKKEAEESNKAKTIFMANMSHEIRTPLNAIIGFSGLLQKTEMTQEQKKFSQMISQSSEHLLSVVNEILFLFKFGMGKVYIEHIPFNIHELIKDVHESLSLKADEKNISFTIDVTRNVAKVVIGDPVRVKQILMNLASNAINFTEKGEVRIRVIREKLTRKDVFLRFDVTDTGIGIPQEDMGIIFDEFAQSKFSKKTNNKGIGLGLTIVKKLVDLLHGRLYVESTVDEGSKFTVVLPFTRTHLAENPLPAKNYELNYNLLEGKKILYADDDENNILLGEWILKTWNIDYNIAKDGGAALELLRQKKFDIVLLDIRMPVLKGTEVAEHVRTDKNNPNVNAKIIAVTANVMDSEIKHYMKSGFNGFILKPFDEVLLFNKICNALELEGNSIKDKPMITDTKEDEMGFDTSILLKTTGGNTEFFNKMLDTFVTNARDTSESFRKLQESNQWTLIGEKAHKAIPSFSFFKLTGIVEDLTKIENLALREKKNQDIAPLATKVSADIDKVIEVAQKSYLNT
jgi:signal transduction histidine kinase/HPt (histidine-containing phosphotransfer) domain-containing protein/ActR/RegA family two-component response regulator